MIIICIHIHEIFRFQISFVFVFITFSLFAATLFSIRINELIARIKANKFIIHSWFIPKSSLVFLDSSFIHPWIIIDPLSVILNNLNHPHHELHFDSFIKYFTQTGTDILFFAVLELLSKPKTNLLKFIVCIYDFIEKYYRSSSIIYWQHQQFIVSSSLVWFGNTSKHVLWAG